MSYVLAYGPLAPSLGDGIKYGITLFIKKKISCRAIGLNMAFWPLFGWRWPKDKDKALILLNSLLDSYEHFVPLLCMVKKL